MDTPRFRIADLTGYGVRSLKALKFELDAGPFRKRLLQTLEVHRSTAAIGPSLCKLLFTSRTEEKEDGKVGEDYDVYIPVIHTTIWLIILDQVFFLELFPHKLFPSSATLTPNISEPPLFFDI